MTRRDLFILAGCVLVALVAAMVAFFLTGTDVGEQGPEGVAGVTATPSLTLTPPGAVAPARTPGAAPSGTPSQTPEPSPTATLCSPPADWEVYIVRPGDTLSRIASWYGLTAGEIQVSNCLSSTEEIFAGQSLYVPWLVTPTPTPCLPPSGWVLYMVQPGETLFRIAQRYGMTAAALQEANCLSSADDIMAGQYIYVPFTIPPTAAAVAPPAVDTPQVVVGLKEEIFYDPGGEVGDEPTCATPMPGELPTITISTRLSEAYADTYQLCIYGLPAGASGTVDLYTPDDDPAGSRSFLVGAPSGGWTVVKFRLWVPVGLPLGPWHAVARANGEEVQRSFSFERFTRQAISTVPEGDLSPFEPHRCATYSRGEHVVVNGTSFAPNETFPLAVYWLPSPTAPSLKLVRDKMVTTDSRGDFSTSTLVDPSDAAGSYLVVLVTDPAADHYKRTDWNNDCYQVP